MSYGGPKGVGLFLWARYPCIQKHWQVAQEKFSGAGRLGTLSSHTRRRGHIRFRLPFQIRFTCTVALPLSPEKRSDARQPRAGTCTMLPLYRGTSLSRKLSPLGPYRRPMPRVLGGSWGVRVLLWARYPCISSNPLYLIRPTFTPVNLSIYKASLLTRPTSSLSTGAPRF